MLQLITDLREENLQTSLRSYSHHALAHVGGNPTRDLALEDPARDKGFDLPGRRLVDAERGLGEDSTKRGRHADIIH